MPKKVKTRQKKGKNCNRIISDLLNTSSIWCGVLYEYAVWNIPAWNCTFQHLSHTAQNTSKKAKHCEPKTKSFISNRTPTSPRCVKSHLGVTSPPACLWPAFAGSCIGQNATGKYCGWTDHDWMGLLSKLCSNSEIHGSSVCLSRFPWTRHSHPHHHILHHDVPWHLLPLSAALLQKKSCYA